MGRPLAAAWFPTGLAVQRAFHLTHHRHNRSEAEQFDVLHAGDVKWLKQAQWYAILTGCYWWITVAGVLGYLVMPKALRTWLLSRTSAQVAAQTSAAHYVGALDALDPLKARFEVGASIALQATLFWAIDLSVTGWLACYAAFAFSWSSVQYTDHAFSPLDAKEGAWNLQVTPLARVLFLNYPLHLAHHQHPLAPWVHLGSLATPGPRFMDVWREAWRGPRNADQFPQFAMITTAHRRWPLPTGPDARVTLGFGVAFLAVFVLLFGGASVLSGLIPWSAAVDLPFERDLPFMPAWSLVYLSLIPLMLVLPLAAGGWRGMFPVFATLLAETAFASIVFVAFPVHSSFAPRDATGPWQDFFWLANTLNLERNFFPSLHVAFAVTAALALAARSGPWQRLALFAWAGAIAASTLLIHEHQLVDVVAGALLAACMWRQIGRWAARDDVLERVDIELLCLRNAWLFARRHRRYALIAVMLFVDSLPRWRMRRVLRTGYCFLQAVDDVLDGDRACSGDPLDQVDELMQALRSRRFGTTDLMRLAQAFMADLIGVAGEAHVEAVVALLAVMRQDRCRVLERALWRREELQAQHRATFTLSLDLLLAARGAALRVAHVPELVEALGWCSVMRDLRQDLSAGLVNVPIDVVKAAGRECNGVFDVDALLSADAMRHWMTAERGRAVALLDVAERRLDDLRGGAGEPVLRLFARSVRAFAGARYSRLYPGVRPA